MSKFKTPESNPLLSPCDYFNFFGSFISIFEGIKTAHAKSETEICMMDPEALDSKYHEKPTFVLSPTTLIVEVKGKNPYDIATGQRISKFMLLTAVKFKGDFFAAQSFVAFNIMKSEIPYIRVGTDYYKVIKKENRYGTIDTLIKPWKKDEIKEDHTKAIISKIYRFDDFTIYPDNKTFTPTRNGCYNLYSKFPHKPHTNEVSPADIPITMGVINHIFGDQWSLGLRYMKILYEYPMQILPILSLVSVERETGKTTFLNWISMLFGENSVLIAPADLTNNFNSGYATKNIIMVDETVIEKSTSVEKLKSLGTAKTISVQQKFVQQYSIPFFGKIILCTNKEEDFMKIDEEEIRFWIRKIKPITGTRNTNIENDLFKEIPKFLRLLSDLPGVDFSRSRMVFTDEEIGTDQLKVIKKESHSSLRKQIEIHCQAFFDRTQSDYFEATVLEIKTRWFPNNSQISPDYISKVLRKEMKMTAEQVKKYSPFDDNGEKILGRPYLFKNSQAKFVKSESKKGEIITNLDIDDPF